MLAQVRPTTMVMPSDYPGGNGSRVMLCEFGCLVSEMMAMRHAQAAHADPQ